MSCVLTDSGNWLLSACGGMRVLHRATWDRECNYATLRCADKAVWKPTSAWPKTSSNALRGTVESTMRVGTSADRDIRVKVCTDCFTVRPIAALKQGVSP